MPRINLTTFLFNDSVDSVEKARRLGKYANDPGGGDYYWGAKEAAKKLFGEDAPYDAAIAVMANISQPTRRTDNELALRNLYAWKLKHPGVAIPTPVGTAKGPQGELIVTLRPAYGWLSKAKHEAYVLWTYKDVRLSSRLAGMGVYLLELHLRHGPFANMDFYILDVETGRRFGRRAISKDTPIATVMALQYQEELYLQAKKAA